MLLTVFQKPTWLNIWKFLKTLVIGSRKQVTGKAFIKISNVEVEFWLVSRLAAQIFREYRKQR